MIRCRGGLFRLDDRGGVDLEIAVVLAPQRRAGALAGGQGRVEGAEIGAQDLRAAQAPRRNSPPRPSRGRLHSHIRPLPQMIVLSLSSMATPSGMPSRICSFCSSLPISNACRKYLRGDEDAVEPVPGQQGQRPHRVLHDRDLVAGERVAEHLLDAVARITDQQDFRFRRQRGHSRAGRKVLSPSLSIIRSANRSNNRSGRGNSPICWIGPARSSDSLSAAQKPLFSPQNDPRKSLGTSSVARTDPRRFAPRTLLGAKSSPAPRTGWRPTPSGGPVADIAKAGQFTTPMIHEDH